MDDYLLSPQAMILLQVAKKPGINAALLTVRAYQSRPASKLLLHVAKIDKEGFSKTVLDIIVTIYTTPEVEIEDVVKPRHIEWPRGRALDSMVARKWRL